jgi:hypothetical protein
MNAAEADRGHIPEVDVHLENTTGLKNDQNTIFEPSHTGPARNLSSCLLFNAPNASTSQRKGTSSSKYATNFSL